MINRCSAASCAALALLVSHTAAAAQGEVTGAIRNGGQGLEGAAVYLLPEGGVGEPLPRQPVTIDQVHLKFVPDVVVVVPGTSVSFLNSDGVLHNVFGPGQAGQGAFDLGTYDRNDWRERIFRDAGLHVVLCHIHPEMAAYVIVTPTPYTATTGPSGRFTIADVPPGRYRLVAWHPRHWRSDVSVPVEVGDNGLNDVAVTLGRTRGPAR
ncbi:MAG: carboxypeptidase regulatory-like domain-containing protein [Gemmatimonadota bacterium]|nr:carboxypeptidase regulatory-like domain-containing protein [Gemmatimonadota bacterium]